jgi:CRP-like cAMP-binding protein
LLNGRASAVEYICLTPARVVSVRYADALRAFEQDSEFSRYIARLVIWRGQQHAEMLALMRVGSPSLRVVMGLALLTEAIVSNSSHLPRYDLDASLQIPLKQALLASMCGVSRGIFSVCLQQLAASGWLRVDYATVELQSIKTWSKFAHAHRHNRQNHSKTSMQELLILMQKASVHDDELMAFQN